ncbi:MAG: hypothetical protein J6X42_04135 [Alphaproteobacteria bacterium]|nr:hypothetical protein [Alphaproteobacteria bacterium]
MRVFLCLFLMAVSTAQASDEVEIFGAANTKSGKPVQATIDFEEPSSPPIIPVFEKRAPEPKSIEPAPKPEPAFQNEPKKIEQWSPQNPKPFSISPEAQKDEIENTLYEGGDRIYDVQSFPIKDIGIITKPNIDPTISTYPEY